MLHDVLQTAPCWQVRLALASVLHCGSKYNKAQLSIKALFPFHDHIGCPCLEYTKSSLKTNWYTDTIRTGIHTRHAWVLSQHIKSTQHYFFLYSTVSLFLTLPRLICYGGELSDWDWSWATNLNLRPEGSSVQTRSSPSPFTPLILGDTIPMYKPTEQMHTASANYFYLDCNKWGLSLKVTDTISSSVTAS